MVATVVKQLGRLDIAINNAGMNKNHAAEDCSAGDWDQTFELNTKGVFLCCQVASALPHCIDHVFAACSNHEQGVS